MPVEKTRVLYDAVSKDYDIGTFDDFKIKMSQPEKRKAFYDGVGAEYQLGTFEEFDSKLGSKPQPQLPAPKQGLQFGYSMPADVPITPKKAASPKELVELIKLDPSLQTPSAQVLSPETKEYISRLGDRAIRGMNSFNSMLAKTPEFVYNLAAVPQNYIAEQFDVESLATSAEKVKKDLGITNELAQMYDNEVNKLAYLDAKYSKNDNSITDLISGGKYTDAAKLLGEQIVESLPTTAAIAATGGMGASPTAVTLGGGLVFGAGKYDEIKDREDLTESQKAEISLSTGLVEGLFENIGTANLGRIGKEIFLSEGVDVAKEKIAKTFVETYKEVLKRYLPISGAVSEGLEEAGTQFAQNAIDSYGGVDPNKKLTDGVLDAFIVGTGSGAVISSPTLLSKKRNDAAKKIETEVTAIDNDINREDVDPIVKEQLVQARQEKMAELNTVIAEDVQEQKTLPDEVKRKVEELQSTKEVLTQTLETDISEESKVALQDRIDKIESEIETEVSQSVTPPEGVVEGVVKESVETPKSAEEVTVTEEEMVSLNPQVGDKVSMPPRIEGGQPVVMEFTEEGWKQNVGNELTNVAESVREAAQTQFENERTSTNKGVNTSGTESSIKGNDATVGSIEAGVTETNVPTEEVVGQETSPSVQDNVKELEAKRDLEIDEVNKVDDTFEFLPNKEVKGVEVEMEVEVAETGKKQKVMINALKAQNELKKRVSMFKKLKDCVG